MEERKRTGRARAEMFFFRGDGSRFPGECSSQVFTDDDGQLRTVLIVRDLTHAKEVEAAKERYLKLFTLSTEPMCIADPFGCFMQVNPAFAEITGYSESELISKPFLDFVLAEDQERTRAEMERQVSLGPSVAFENRYVCKDGQIIQLSWYAYFDKADNITYATARDVTQENQMKRDLITSEARYRSVVTAMAEGVVFQGLDGAVIATNPAAQAIEGRADEEMLGHDSDDPMWGAVRVGELPFPGIEHPAMQTLRTGEPQKNIVMGIRRPNGERRWISINSQPVRTTGGKIDGVVTTFHDITELKQAQEALSASENLFRTLADTTAAGIFIATGKQYIFANAAMENLTGYSAAELKQMHVADIMHPDDRPILVERVRKFENHEDLPPTYEIRLQTKSGEVRWVEVRVREIDYEGTRSRIGTMFDITETKKAAEKISIYVTQLEKMTVGALQAVANMVDLRDPYTSGHERRVGSIAADIAHEMGWNEARCQQLQWAGMVHDIGKIAVPAEILSKPTRLTQLEYELIKGHAEQGYQILKDLEFPFPIAEIIRQHHERIDGSGYPRGLKGEEILPEARILAVADVLESMSSHRPYRPALGLNAALDELKQGRATHYDEQVVDAVMRMTENKGYRLPN